MKSLAELQAIKDKTNQELGTVEKRVLVGMATCGIAAGASPVYDVLANGVKGDLAKTVSVKQTGCVGICQYEPVVEIYEGDKRTTYVKMTAEKAQKVLEDHIKNGKVVYEYTIGANN